MQSFIKNDELTQIKCNCSWQKIETLHHITGNRKRPGMVLRSRREYLDAIRMQFHRSSKKNTR